MSQSGQEGDEGGPEEVATRLDGQGAGRVVDGVGRIARSREGVHRAVYPGYPVLPCTPPYYPALHYPAHTPPRWSRCRTCYTGWVYRARVVVGAVLSQYRSKPWSRGRNNILSPARTWASFRAPQRCF